MLWCSWVIRSPRYKIFISGATGYAKVFQSIGRKYGPFHMAALPIGGYEPKSRNGYGNVTPEQAVQIHKDILAMCSLALSWGTFALSNEVPFSSYKFYNFCFMHFKKICGDELRVSSNI